MRHCHSAKLELGQCLKTEPDEAGFWNAIFSQNFPLCYREHFAAKAGSFQWGYHSLHLSLVFVVTSWSLCSDRKDFKQLNSFFTANATLNADQRAF